MTSEADLGAMLCQAVPFALPTVRIFRRNILNVQTAAGWRARAGIKGQADYYAIAKGGRHIELETKAAKATWYSEQVAWREFCRAFEIPYLVLRALPNEAPGDTVGRWIAELRGVAC